MQQHKQGIGAGIELNRTGCPQSSRIARRQRQLAEPLQRDDTEHEKDEEALAAQGRGRIRWGACGVRHERTLRAPLPDRLTRFG